MTSAVPVAVVRFGAFVAPVLGAVATGLALVAALLEAAIGFHPAASST